MNNLDYKKHFLGLSILYILGNGIITLPTASATKYTFFSFLISFIITVLLLFLSFFPLKVFPNLLAVWVIGDTFIDFVKFISQTLLQNSPKVLIILPFLTAVIIFGFAPQRAIFKFSLLSAFFCVIAIFFFFGFTAKDFEIENVIIKTLPSFKDLYMQTMPYIKKVAIPCFLLGNYAKQYGFSKKTVFLSISLGNGVLAFCILNSILLFSSKFAGLLAYPYVSAISTVTFGNLFCRLDGFAYFIYFASCLIKITVSVQIIKRPFGRFSLSNIRKLS